MLEFLINRNPSGWILTLINNAGITKSHHYPPVIDASQNKQVNVELNMDFLEDHMEGQLLANVKNLVTNETLWQFGGSNFTGTALCIDPGELAVLKFEFS